MISADQIVDVKFSPENNSAIQKYVHDQIEQLTYATRDLFQTKVAKWRRLYRGTPSGSKKNFPWANASNICIQLIGSNVDIMRSITLASVFEVDPLFKTELIGDYGDDVSIYDQQNAIELLLNVAGRDNHWLDLYRVYSAAEDERVKFGTTFIKNPWETLTEQMVTGVSSGVGKNSLVETEFTRYDSPMPEKLRFEDFLVTTTVPTLEKAPFKCHIIRGLTKHDLLERVARGIYNPTTVDEILKQPDYHGTDSSRQKEHQDKSGNTGKVGINEDSGEAKWDVHECWFKFFVNDNTYRIGPYVYHFNTRQVLRKVFNFYPDNQDPFEMGRLGYTEDGIYGFGFCEMLEHYQEGASTLTNQDLDSRTAANTGVIFAHPDSKLDSNFSAYPLAIIPVDPEQISLQALGRTSPDNQNMLAFLTEMARNRAGVEQGFDAPGAAIVNPKKGGITSAMGTFAVMQAGNRRSNINITDFRFLHSNLGRRFLQQFAHFNLAPKYLRRFGTKTGDLIKAGLESVRDGRIDIFVKAATASINKEVEKQNDILLTQVLQRHHQMIAGIVQNLLNPQMQQPEMQPLAELFMGIVRANNALMSDTLRNFNKDNIAILLPESKLLEQERQQKLIMKKVQEMQAQMKQFQPQGGQGGQPPNGAEQPPAPGVIQ